MSSPKVSLSVESVNLYYSGRTVTKDVFFGSRYEVNFGAYALGHIGITAVFSSLNDGTFVFGYGFSVGFGFSPFVFQGDVNYGTTKEWNDKMF